MSYYSLTGGLNKHLLWGPGYGIGSSAYSSALNLVAFAEKAVLELHPGVTLSSFMFHIPHKGIKPIVYVHDCKSNQRVAQITGMLYFPSVGAAELEITAMTFSADGTRIATASGEPDFSLVLWDVDVDKGSVAKLVDSRMEWAVEFISFSPVTIDQVCVSGNGNAALWIYQRSFHRTSFICKILLVDACPLHCHCWARSGDIIYVGSLSGEVLSFDLSSPARSATKTPMDNASPVDTGPTNTEVGQVLIKLVDAEKISHICAGDRHLVAIGTSGHLRWVMLPRQIVMEKSVQSAGEPKSKRPHKIEKGHHPKDEKLNYLTAANLEDAKEAHVVHELILDVPFVTTMQYRNDDLQLLVGSTSGAITTIGIDFKNLQSQVLKPLSLDSNNSEKGVKIDWQGDFHRGAVLAIGSLRAGKFIVTAGKDGTVRVWTADGGKELSRQSFGMAQTCMATSEDASVVSTGAVNGYLHVFKVDTIGRLAIVFYMKLHSGPLDQISFSHGGTHVVAVAKTDARLFFLYNKALDYEDLDLLGYIAMKEAILSHTWDIPTAGAQDFFVLLSLIRGEIVKLKVPVSRAPGGGLIFESKALRQISFRVAVPLNAIVVGKYYLEKEGVERRILWGFGQDKRFQQFRLPDNLSAWTGTEAVPHAPHFNIPGHLKPGSALGN